MIAMGDLLTGAWVAAGISAAARLGVADHMGDTPVGVDELARATGANEDALYRLLRMLAAAGVFREAADRRFALTDLGALLRRDHPDSMRGFAAYNGEPWHWRMWGELERSVRTGKPALPEDGSESLFEYLGGHQEAAAVFDAAMADLSNARDVSAISGYDFSQFGTVVDVGGGEGRLVRSVLASFPSVKGILYDLPVVIARARPIIASEGLTERCAVVGGSFFDAVPPGGDVYMLKQVLHDWPDEQALTILKNCQRALQPGGKVLIFELMVAEHGGPDIGKLSDIEMLVATGGRERTQAQYDALLSAAGLRTTRVFETRSPFSIIEAISGR